MNGTTGRSATLVLLAAAMVVAAGCASSDTGPRTSTSAPTTTTVASTTSAAPRPVTLTDMAAHPCRAIDDEQMLRLLAIPGQSQEGGEQETGFRQCQWATAQGALLFGHTPRST